MQLGALIYQNIRSYQLTSACGLKQKVSKLELRIINACPVNALHSNAITALKMR